MKKLLSIQKESPNNFAEIFNDMQNQFPPEELKSFDDFVILLENDNYLCYNILYDNKNIGYFLSFFDNENNTVWVDYLAIKEEFHSMGYGSGLIKIFKQNFLNLKGIFFEVEKEDKKYPNTINRASFYRKNDVNKLQIKHLLPTEESYLEMDLYFLPLKTGEITKQEIFSSIKNAFGYLHQRLNHTDEIYAKILEINKES